MTWAFPEGQWRMIKAVSEQEQPEDPLTPLTGWEGKGGRPRRGPEHLVSAHTHLRGEVALGRLCPLCSHRWTCLSESVSPKTSLTTRLGPGGLVKVQYVLNLTADRRVSGRLFHPPVPCSLLLPPGGSSLPPPDSETHSSCRSSVPRVWGELGRCSPKGRGPAPGPLSGDKTMLFIYFFAALFSNFPTKNTSFLCIIKMLIFKRWEIIHILSLGPNSNPFIFTMSSLTHFCLESALLVSEFLLESESHKAQLISVVSKAA